MNTLFSSVYLLSCFVTFASCWVMFSDMANEPKARYEPEMMHSVYVYGDCKRKGIILFSHIHKESIDILGKLFVRGWLDIKRIPTCIILKSYSFKGDLLRGTTENFQICVPRITYCHTHKRYKYYYYEWHLPYFFKGGMNWELFFYGPPSLYCYFIISFLLGDSNITFKAYSLKEKKIQYRTIFDRNIVKFSSCWQAYFTTLVEDKDNARTEYVFGNCDFHKDIKLYTTVEFEAADMKEKVIMRGIMDEVKRQPTCVILRSKGDEADTYQDTPYSFQICVARITYIFSRIRHNMFFYEFYIPPGFNSKVDWEISIYGPSKVLDF